MRSKVFSQRTQRGAKDAKKENSVLLASFAPFAFFAYLSLPRGTT
jgi:hypothetical protein